jgi:predicted DNA-binding ribbon-helix-helix protein
LGGPSVAHQPVKNIKGDKPTASVRQYITRWPAPISTNTESAPEPVMKSLIVKRSIVISGHKTSVSLEDAFWKGLKEVAGGRSMTLSDLIASIDTGRKHGNLSSAIRLFVLDFYRNQLEETAARHSAAARLASSA